MKIKSSLLAASCVFAIGALPASAVVVFTDTFAYADGPLVTASSSPWVTHSGTANQVNVTTGAAFLTSSESEDVSATLSGSPYTVGILTATFDVNFSALPTATGAYLVHFKDIATGFRSRLYASTTGAATGSFRLGITNAGNSVGATVNVAADLGLSTTYTITMTWNLDTLVSTLAITGVNGGAAVTATDTTNNTAIAVTGFALRQSLSSGQGMGSLTVDNLSVSYVPEPNSAALLGAMGLLGILRRRR